jgi:hypothetical protein
MKKKEYDNKVGIVSSFMTREQRKLLSGIARFSLANLLIYCVFNGDERLEKVDKAIQHAMGFCPHLGSFCGNVISMVISVTVLYLFLSGLHCIVTHLDVYS